MYWLAGWLKGRNRRTKEEGLFPAGEFVKFIPPFSSVLRPKPVPKPRMRSATSTYVTKSEINDSGYDGSPRGIIFTTILKLSFPTYEMFKLNEQIDRVIKLECLN